LTGSLEVDFRKDHSAPGPYLFVAPALTKVQIASAFPRGAWLPQCASAAAI
jgi:hypothetical protein